MKTRDQIYHRDGEKLLRFLTTYHALKYEQVMKMFGNQDSIRSLITSLNKQGRIYYDKGNTPYRTRKISMTGL